MKTIHLSFKNGQHAQGAMKLLGFISDEITSVHRENNVLHIEINSDKNEQIIEDQIRNNLMNYDVDDGKVIFMNKKKDRVYHCFEEAEISQKIKVLENGQVVLNDQAVFLYKWFDQYFLSISRKCDAKEKMYPTMYPVKDYEKTGYLNNSPQYAIFCSPVKGTIKNIEELHQKVNTEEFKDCLDMPSYALPPAACFNLYKDIRSTTLDHCTSYTFIQNTFRNEGRFSYNEIGRLSDFHMREIVAVGDSSYVSLMRLDLIEETKKLLLKLDMDADISIANDAFVLPKMQKFKKIQRLEKSKYELHLYCDNEKSISCASYNFHGTAFSESFHLAVKDVEDVVTGCVGFGIERWVIAFVCQYGINAENWPEALREDYEKQLN